MSAPYKAYAYLTLAMVIVGSSAVAGTLMIYQLPVHLASALRFGLALILLVPLMLWQEKGIPRLRLQTHLLLFFQAVCGSFLFTLLFLEGLRRTSPASAGIITSTTPACMAMIAWIAFRERPERRALLGVACSIGGVLLVQLAQASSVGRDSVISSGAYGNVLVIGAVFFESLFLLLRKAMHEPLSPLTASTFVCFYGLLLFLPLGLSQAAQTDWSALSNEAWIAVGYYAFVVTVLAYIFWFAGIVSVPAGTAGIFTGVMPVSAVFLSSVFLGENIGRMHLAGCLGVVSGIYLICGTGRGTKRAVDLAGSKKGSSPFASAGFLLEHFLHLLHCKRR